MKQSKDGINWQELTEMTMGEYQVLSARTDKCPGNLEYHILALAAEAGEVAGKMSKIIRDRNGEMIPTDNLALLHELGDVLWHLTQAAKALGFTLDQVAIANIEKLYDREKRGKISGSGDSR